MKNKKIQWKSETKWIKIKKGKRKVIEKISKDTYVQN